MTEIKSRIMLAGDCVNEFHDERPEALVGRVELASLQIRKIIEIIAFASISAHKEQYFLLKKRYDKENDFVKICNKLEKINHHFLPKKVIFHKFVQIDNKSIPSIEIDDENSPNKRELIKMHGKYGNILHANNPYSSPVDYHLWATTCQNDINRLIEFLGIHAVKIDANFNRFCIVQLHRPPDGMIDIMFSEGDFF